MKLFTFLLTGLLIVIYPTRVHGIIILPAIILIPIAQLIAVIVSGFSIPALSMGILIAKFKKNRKLAIIAPLVLLISIAIISAVILKWKHPDNPWI